MIERFSLVEREQLVEMQVNNEKNNHEDAVLELECLESWNHKGNSMKTWNSKINFTDCK